MCSLILSVPPINFSLFADAGLPADWYSNNRYQFKSYKGEDDKVFDYDSVDQNIDIAHIPIDSVLVDITYTPRVCRVCQYQPMIPPVSPPKPITDFIQFAQSQSQPEYISQYSAKIAYTYPAIAI